MVVTTTSPVANFGHAIFALSRTGLREPPPEVSAYSEVMLLVHSLTSPAGKP